MNSSVAELIAALRMAVPTIHEEIDSGDDDQSTTWIDLLLGDKSVVLEFRPGRGFGLHLREDAEDEDGYGTRPAEIYREIEPLVRRLKRYFLLDGGPLSLRDIRELRSVTQEQLGELSGKKQAAISKIEGRDDILLRTALDYIAALGGTVSINVHFKEFDVPIKL